MQDRMMEEMMNDIDFIEEKLDQRKDFAQLKKQLEDKAANDRREKFGSKRYTPPKRRMR